MTKFRLKKTLVICGGCGENYKEDGKEWIKATVKNLLDLFARAQKGEQWNVSYVMCSDCERKRKEDKL